MTRPPTDRDQRELVNALELEIESDAAPPLAGVTALAAPLPRDEGVSVGRSPTADDLEQLARRGFRSVVCLNVEGEPDLALSPNVEATWAHTHGLGHVRAAIERGRVDPEAVERALEALRQAERPVYLHSREGRRAAALATVRLGRRRGLAADDALVEAEALGIEVGGDETRRMVRRALA